MRTKAHFIATLAVILIASAPPAWAQAGHGTGHGAGQGPGQGDGQGMAQPMMGGMMQQMMQHMMEHMRESGMGGMGPGMMGPGAMGPGMMGGDTMGPGMMGPGMMGFGGRVVPSLKLTVGDVSEDFQRRLERIGNKRLKLGPVKEVDKDSITVDIVTVDNSLVERLKVNRHNGLISKGDAS